MELESLYSYDCSKNLGCPATELLYTVENIENITGMQVVQIFYAFKVEISPSSKMVLFALKKPFKNGEKCFLLHLKRSFLSQDI